MTRRDSLAQFLSDRFPTERLGGSRAHRAAFRALLWLLRPAGPVLVRTGDYRLAFRPRVADLARTLALGPAWEPCETEAFRAALRPGRAVLDVGANVGHYTLIAARTLGAGTPVAAFEPAPAPRAALEANLALNGLSAVTVVAAACSDADGEAALHLDADNAGGHSLAAGNVVRPGGVLRVPAVTLDGWVARQALAAPIGLIKLDTQGAEPAILAGAQAVLRAHRPTLLVEYWPYGLRRAGSSAEALLAALGDLGYALTLIHEPSRTVAPVTPERLLAGFDAAIAHSFANLLCTPPH
jgi:FkbM family methyltransferase